MVLVVIGHVELRRLFGGYMLHYIHTHIHTLYVCLS